MKAAIVYNPAAMKGKIIKRLPYIQDRLLAKFTCCEAYQTLIGADTSMLVASLCEQYDVIIAAGGDGTIHFVADGIALSGRKVILGVLPFGTVNDVAHNLRVPKNLDKALDIILRGYTMEYDLMYDGKEHIVYTLAGGIFVSSSFSTSKKLKSVWGRLAYIFVGIGALFKYKSLPLTIQCGEQTYEGKYMLCMVLNSYRAAGITMNAESSLNDGLMDVILIRRAKGGFFGFMRALWLVAKLFLGGVKAVRKSKDVTIIKTSNLRIENHSDAAFTADGEKMNFLNKDLKITTSITMFHGANF